MTGEYLVLFILMSLLYFIESNSLSSNVSSHEEANTSDDNLRILVIGDSIDRCMVQDWCLHNLGNLLTDQSVATTNFSAPHSIKDVFKHFGRRGRSWEVRICDSFSSQIMIAMVHNKFGVKPCSPWHCPIATMSGLERELVGNATLDQARNMSNIFRIGLYPCIPAIVLDHWCSNVYHRPSATPLLQPLYSRVSLVQAIGGLPHGVLLNSAFWDLSHPDPSKLRLNSPEVWLKNWATNVSALMEIVQEAFPSTKWFGWHTANWFHAVEEGRHWNTHSALRLLDKMNAVSEKLAMAKGFQWIPFHRFQPLRLKDMLHPTAPSLIWLADTVLAMVRNATSRRVSPSFA